MLSSADELKQWPIIPNEYGINLVHETEDGVRVPLSLTTKDAKSRAITMAWTWA